MTLATTDIGLAVAAAMEHLDRDELRDLIVDMVNVPSPTGNEAPLANMLVERLQQRYGVRSYVQPIDNEQANAVGRLRSPVGDGPDLLLYAPIDTHLSGDPAEDTPWSGERVEPILSPSAYVQGYEIAGLGAENPKAYAACVVTAAGLLARAGIALRGDVIVGLGAGGMPTNKRPSNVRWNVGQGSGVGFMLQQGVRADYAVIAKPVWAISWEEVGVCWFRVRVGGLFGYAGLRHQMPYKNPIILASKVALELEDWLPRYAASQTSGLVAPQGVIGAIEGGFTYKPTFVPAACHLYLDIRVSPRTDPMDVKRALEAELREIQGRLPDVETKCEMLLSIPGSHTPPENWIVRSLIRSWEAIEGRPHEPAAMSSGATDVAILRMWGIPTARLGVPYRPGAGAGHWAGDDPLPMNVVHVDDCCKLVEALVRTAIDTCGRSVTETRASHDS